LCGTVGCATSTCPLVFTRQWSALASVNDSPIAILALGVALQRTQKEYGGGPAWVSKAVAYVNQTLRANQAEPVQPGRLWAVVGGAGASEEAIARTAARNAGVSAIVVARMKVDQGYEPRLIPAE
jgi:hypothetical protein